MVCLCGGFPDWVPSQTATVVQLWRSEKKEKGHLMVEMKKVESREVGGG